VSQRPQLDQDPSSRRFSATARSGSDSTPATYETFVRSRPVTSSNRFTTATSPRTYPLGTRTVRPCCDTSRVIVTYRAGEYSIRRRRQTPVQTSQVLVALLSVISSAGCGQPSGDMGSRELAPPTSRSASSAGACGPTPTNQCVTRWACSKGAWQPSRFEPTSTLCDDANQCTLGDHCDGAGGCIGTNAVATTSCDDANSCTHTDHCDGQGRCAGTPVTCVSTACITRTCNGSSSCAATVKVGAPCKIVDDGAPCVASCNPAGDCESGRPAAFGSPCPFPTACGQVCDGASPSCQPRD
jgi:hypothetical protein